MNVCSRSRIFVSKFRHSVLALPQVRNFRENENFTFDWGRVDQTLEKERKHYEEYNEMMGEAKFSGKFTNFYELKAEKISKDSSCILQIINLTETAEFISKICKSIEILLAFFPLNT